MSSRRIARLRKLVGQKTKYNITGVVGLDAKHDLVLLAVENAAAPTLKLGDSSKVAVGDSIFAVGNPEGLEGTFSQGIISGIRQVDTNSLLQSPRRFRLAAAAALCWTRKAR